MTRFKRFSATLLGRVFMVSMVVAAMLGSTAQNAARAGNSDPWTVTEVNGTALVSHDGAGWQPLRKGDMLRPGSRMKTGRDGRAVLKRPGDSLAVSPNSRFGIPSGQEKRPLGNIFQSLGTLLFKVKTRPQDPFNVKTPYLAAVIRGTTFTVSVGPSNAVLHVAKGAVEVTSVLSGQTVLVRPGESAVVDPRAGGALKLVGRGNRKHQTRIKKSGKSAAATNSGGTRYVIPHRLGDRRVSISRLTKGLVNDASGPRPRKQGQRRGRHGKSGTFASRDSSKGIGIGNGSGNGGLSNGTGNGGISNGTGNGGVGVDSSSGGGISNGAGNGGVDSSSGGGISNGIGSGNNSGPGVGGSGVLKPINAGPSPAALVAKARSRKKIK